MSDRSLPQRRAAAVVAPGSAAPRWQARLRTAFPFATLLLLVIFFSLLSPVFLTLDNFNNILRQMSILLIVALAGTFVILMGSIDLSVGGTVGLAGVVCAWLIANWGWGLNVLPAVAAMGMAIGLINALIYVYGKIPSFLTTLGTLSILQGIILVISNGAAVPFSNRAFTSLATANLFGFPVIALWALAAYGLSVLLAFRTRFGRYVYAIGGGEQVAWLSGVPVNAVKIGAFMLAGLFSAVAGALLTARLQAGAPELGQSMLLDSIAAVVMGGTALTGGVGGPHRTILGVLVIAVLSNGLVILGVHPFHQIIIKGIVVIVAVGLTLDRSKVGVMK